MATRCYRPVGGHWGLSISTGTLTPAVLCALAGTQEPMGYHIVNLLLHVCVSLLVSSTSARLNPSRSDGADEGSGLNPGKVHGGGGELGALLVGLLFATHPVVSSPHRGDQSIHLAVHVSDVAVLTDVGAE